MRLHILSDLHLDCAPYQPLVREADVIVLAGDTHPGLDGIRWARTAWPDKPVVYIAGNHEYYGENYHSHLARMRELAAGSNVHFLEQDSFWIGDVTFLGTTLWTDLNFFGNIPLAAMELSRGLRDFLCIRIEPRYRRLHPSDTARIHRESLGWLAQELGRHAGKKLVVVTHHGVGPLSVPPDYIHDPCQPGYTSQLTNFIRDNPVRLWIHGHTHHAFDYAIGGTGILTNPRGYPHERNHGFNSTLSVDV